MKKHVCAFPSRQNSLPEGCRLHRGGRQEGVTGNLKARMEIGVRGPLQ